MDTLIDKVCASMILFEVRPLEYLFPFSYTTENHNLCIPEHDVNR